MTRIDSHQHFWHYDAVRYGWITDDMSAIRRDVLPDELGPLLAAQRFDGCVAVESHPSLEHTRFLLSLARRHPFIRGVVGWVDLFGPDSGRDLEALATDPLFRGVRLPAQAQADDYLARADVVRGIGQLHTSGLTFDILIRAHQLPAAIELVSRLPAQSFVLDHVAKPRIRDGVLEPWATHLRELARRPNVYAKVSGLVTEADWRSWHPDDVRPYLDVAFEAFGTERVMFGSDWPVCTVAGSYEAVTRAIGDYAAALSASERDALFGGNAMRCYGLRVEARAAAQTDAS